jgi:hypothetical protein
MMHNPTNTPDPVVYTYESPAALQRRAATERAKIAALLRAGKLPYEISAIMGWDEDERAACQNEEAQDG